MDKQRYLYNCITMHHSHTHAPVHVAHHMAVAHTVSAVPYALYDALLCALLGGPASA